MKNLMKETQKVDKLSKEEPDNLKDRYIVTEIRGNRATITKASKVLSSRLKADETKS